MQRRILKFSGSNALLTLRHPLGDPEGVKTTAKEGVDTACYSCVPAAGDLPGTGLNYP
jgi:hypothetical protein